MKPVLFFLATIFCINCAAETIAPLKWEAGHKERQAWSQVLLQQVSASLSSFDKATDWAGFCPKYKSLDTSHRVHTVATLAVAISLYESSYNPVTIFHEPPPLGIDSVGLFQLSYEDKFSWCSMQKKEKTLQNPAINIECAVPRMAQLVSKDSVLSGGSKGAWKGLARYWSTIRPSGKKAQVQAAVKSLDFCR